MVPDEYEWNVGIDDILVNGLRTPQIHAFAKDNLHNSLIIFGTRTVLRPVDPGLPSTQHEELYIYIS